MQRISVIDTHTGGEPTRVVVSGGPDLGSGSMADRLAVFRDRHDTFRTAVVGEPRGSDVMVGAILLPPVDRSCAAGVIFFNNVGYLGMCGHGTIGVAVALAHLGRIGPARNRIETPVGPVTASLEGANVVTIDNVESHRLIKAAKVEVPGLGTYTGDVAWGGNWFFLVHEHGETFERGQRRSSDGCDLAHPPGPHGEPESPAPAVPRSITSSSTARLPCPELTASASCSARAGRTIDRLAARAPVPRSLASSPTAS